MKMKDENKRTDTVWSSEYHPTRPGDLPEDLNEAVENGTMDYERALILANID